MDILPVVFLEVEEVYGIYPDQVKDQSRDVDSPLFGCGLAWIIEEGA